MNDDRAVPGAPLLSRRRLSLFLMALWFGLAAGLVELLLLVIRALLFEKGFFLRSNHFVWMVPLSDLVIFGLAGVAASLPWPRRFSPRAAIGVFLSLSLLSQLLLVRGLNLPACVLFSVGVAFQASRWIASHAIGFRRVMRWGWPVLVLILIGLIAQANVQHGLRLPVVRGEPVTPTASAPNVLLITMDTVRADHLSLYGYCKETTPNLSRLAAGGVRFDLARATAPWTLPSHASMLTGCLPHELAVEQLGRLNASHPTLAEVLRSRGYSTAGFVANQFFCGHESGLARGFDSYQDYPTGPAEILRSSSLGWLAFRAAARIRGELGRLISGDQAGGIVLDFARKDAATINAEFLDWVSGRRSRPFFAFLNYFDAHDPYILPEEIRSAFKPSAKSRATYEMLRDWQTLKKDELPPSDIALARIAYDECIASLDHELGRLFDELSQRDLLKQTVVIVTADHGEQFGEHGSFGHGMSLYQSEIHVPLLIHFPEKVPAGRVVREAVSLRDLPATVLDLAGGQETSPLPGRSLATAWREPGSAGFHETAAPFSELERPIEKTSKDPRSAGCAGSLRAIVVDQYFYIRHGDGGEELYNLQADPAEEFDQSDSAEAQPVLVRCREILAQQFQSNSTNLRHEPSSAATRRPKD